MSKMTVMEKKEELLKELEKENLQVLMTAYMYAKGLNMYGEDVTRKILTATENTAMLDKAYQKGYYDAMEKVYKNTDTAEHLKVNIAYSLNDVICLGPSIDDEVRRQLSISLAEAIKNKILINEEEIVAGNLNAIKYSTDIFINFGKGL